MAHHKRRSILVVDDMLLNRRLMGRLVQSFGFDVLFCCDGREAIDQYQQREKDNDLFCILMDVQMPGGVDGLEATKKIRSIEAAAAAAAAAAASRQKTCQEAIRSASALAAAAPSCTPPVRRVPIVGVSACTEQDQLKSAALQGVPIDPATETPWQAVGMDQFMQKPVSKDKLRAALDAILDAEQWQTYAAAPPCSMPRPSLGSHAGSLSCGAFASMSGGVDIKVRSRAGSQQVVKRSLGGCLVGSSSAGLSEPAEKRARLGDAADFAVQTSSLVACQQPAA